jgi:hypothetical protein
MQNGAFKVALTPATATTGGTVLSLANTQEGALIITRLVLDVTTGSTGVATVDAGIAATATTTADNLIDGQSVQTAGVFDNVKQGGTNGVASRKWAANQFLTITPSASAAGLVGYAYIEWIRV